MASSPSAPSWVKDVDQPSGSKVKTIQQPWEALGVDRSLAQALAIRGFRHPTPIQRASIPHSLSIPHRDVLGMARTGSGKTLAYLVPLLQRLNRSHVSVRGARSLVLCPNRELALQILKVGKDLARNGLGSGSEGGSQRLKWALVIGGDPMDKQFEELTGAPDIIIATPGRFLHLVVEMSLDLRTLQVIVYDEADRLFEMGFELQLQEILNRLPPSRQNLLFSATLPTSVTEFAKAGLSNPLLIRLDSDSKISPDLKMAFFAVKPVEKDAALLVLLDRVLHIRADSSDRAIIFVATKHHVEYLTPLLKAAGYRVAHVYGSLDQVARQSQLESFRIGDTSLLVVTDVAARGLDIPVMENVINYDFPGSSRVFVHRVGRTARAGRKGSAWSLITRDDMAHLFDLEQFLGTRFLDADHSPFGVMPTRLIEEKVEHILVGLDGDNPSLSALRQVMKKGQAMYYRSRSRASHESYRKARIISRRIQEGKYDVSTHLAFPEEANEDATGERTLLLSSIQSYRPYETVFELGSRGRSDGAVLMAARREHMNRRAVATDFNAIDGRLGSGADMMPVRGKVFRDSSFFLSHQRADAVDQKGYALEEDSSSSHRIQAAAFNLPTDEGTAARSQRPSQLKWDRKSKRFVQGSTVGADNKKMIRSESGALLPATYNSGRFRRWQAQTKRSKPHSAGDPEKPGEFHSNRRWRPSTPVSHHSHLRNPRAHGERPRIVSKGLLSAESIRKRKSKAESVSPHTMHISQPRAHCCPWAFVRNEHSL